MARGAEIFIRIDKTMRYGTCSRVHNLMYLEIETKIIDNNTNKKPHLTLFVAVKINGPQLLPLTDSMFWLLSA